jgi:hypothetical protein
MMTLDKVILLDISSLESDEAYIEIKETAGLSNK